MRRPLLRFYVASSSFLRAIGGREPAGQGRVEQASPRGDPEPLAEFTSAEGLEATHML